MWISDFIDIILSIQFSNSIHDVSHYWCKIKKYLALRKFWWSILLSDFFFCMFFLPLNVINFLFSMETKKTNQKIWWRINIIFAEGKSRRNLKTVSVCITYYSFDLFCHDCWLQLNNIVRHNIAEINKDAKLRQTLKAF